MCQAYDAEAASISRMEDRETCKGFAAHRDGRGLKDNPNNPYSKYAFEAWEHGWSCREENIVPWAVEKKYHAKIVLETGRDSYDRITIEEADGIV